MPYKKSEEKRRLILEAAKRVFQEKGYKNVSMTDILQESKISKGGIYLYFKSVREIFETIINQPQENDLVLEEEGLSSKEKIRLFLESQIQEIANPDQSLIAASYEYMLSVKDELSPEVMGARFSQAVGSIKKILDEANKSGELNVDSKFWSQHIVWFIEGLRISSTVMQIKRTDLNRQLSGLMEQLESNSRNQRG
ncbi:MAG: TetR/AcrR family transcriptional regulator [Treponema sp.]|nr:TetR/AcrR family transcriptional regulator [Treponema sp.]MBP5754060.1 TetR/AcrR family transcriptional regulator [Treponema sp.]